MGVSNLKQEFYNRKTSFFTSQIFRLLLTLIYILISTSLFGAATVSNVSVSPGTVSAGSNITVDFDYTSGSSEFAWCVVIRPSSAGSSFDSTWDGVATQDVFIDNNNINEYHAGPWGQQIGINSSGVVGGSGSISTYYNVELTIPAGYADGDYYVIVIVRQASSIYTNSWEAEAYQTLTVGAASPIIAAKTANPTTVCEGDNVTFCITATNTGGSPYTFDIWDTVPSGLTYVNCDNSCSQSGGVVSWTVTNLAASGEVTRCYWASADAVYFYEANKIFFAYNRLISWPEKTHSAYSALDVNL